MHISLLTSPARGDIEPFIALAVRLKQQGHTVTLASPPDLAKLAADYGIDFIPLGPPYRPVIVSAAQAGAIGGAHPVRKLRFYLSHRSPAGNTYADTWRAAQGADLIIYKYPSVTAHTIAEKVGIPSVPVMLFPSLRTEAFPSFRWSRGIDRGPLLNRLVWTLPDQARWTARRRGVNAWRHRLGLPALPIRLPDPLRQCDKTPVLCAWSEAVLPKPPDWPERVYVTGYWFLDPLPGWQPPAKILEFLAAGPPPVSIGFGSMASQDRDATLEIALDALEISGQRGIFLSGWGDIGSKRPLPDHVVCAEDLPHSWLFPQVRAVVHHGGAGTTGAGLRAGVPAVVSPVANDQPSWGQLVHSLGTGSAPIPFRELTARRLAEAIRTVLTDRAIRRRASEIGELIRAEDGPEHAIRLSMQYAQDYGCGASA